MKKPWETPKLIVLVRGEPGERVLAACKGGVGETDPSTTFVGCDQPITGARMIACDPCSDYGDS